jgi:hypothetical protein
MNFKKVLILCLLIIASKFYTQNIVSAKIEIDDYANLHINQKINFSIDTLRISKDILIHSRYAKLLRNESQNSISYMPKKNDSIFYTYSPPSKKSSSDYKITNDFLFTTAEFLALSKKNYSQKKKFDLEFISPKYKIVYPNSEDLKKSFKTTPPLIAGNFNNFFTDNFSFYYLSKDAEYEPKIKDISKDFKYIHDFYSSILGENIKPKIFFLPIDEGDGLGGRTFENLIAFNTLFYIENADKQIIAHELNHLWFGEDGLTFKNRRVTEGFAEFFALLYLQQADDKNYFNEVMRRKYYNSEGFSSSKTFFDKEKSGREDHRISYELIPLYLFTKFKNNPKFLNLISEFYRINKSKNKIDFDDFEIFLQSKNVDRVFNEKDILPDFFITNYSENEVAINFTSDKNINVEVEFTGEKGKIEVNQISFSKDKREKIINIKKINKIVIDPNYKILQISRINDVWNKSDTSLLNKNRYFTTEKINPKAIEISNEVIEFLQNKNKTEISESIIKLTENQRLDFQNLKNNFYNNTDIIFTGGVLRHSENNKAINLKLAYFEKVGNKSKVIGIDLKTDLKILENFRILNYDN